MLLPYEPNRHMFFTTEHTAEHIAGNVDGYGDSYARDVGAQELKELFRKMPEVATLQDGEQTVLRDLVIRTISDDTSPGWLFQGLRMFFDFPDVEMTDGVTDAWNGAAGNTEESHRVLWLASLNARFAGAQIAGTLSDITLTHVVVSDVSDVGAIRKEIAGRSKLPRIVTCAWVEECWKEKTLMDEERFSP